jgi:hypothetical protein
MLLSKRQRCELEVEWLIEGEPFRVRLMVRWNPQKKCFDYLLTNLPQGRYTIRIICLGYKLRWKVELAIKRWKNVLDVDALRAKAGSPLAEVWLHGNLLYALLLERRMRRKLGDRWGRLDPTRRVTWWRVWGLLKDEIAPMVTGALFWKEEAWTACLNVLAECPRQRTLQQLPPEAVAVLYHNDEPQQESQPIVPLLLLWTLSTV